MRKAVVCEKLNGEFNPELVFAHSHCVMMYFAAGVFSLSKLTVPLSTGKWNTMQKTVMRLHVHVNVTPEA